MKLKNGQLFWGFFFLTIGILFLLEKKDYLCINFEEIWGYWPILLILAGLAVMFKDNFIRPVLSIISGVLLGLFLFASFFFLYDTVDCSDNDFSNSHYNYSTFSEEFIDSNSNATLRLNAGVGKVKIEGTTTKLFEGHSSGFFNSYDVNTNSRFDRTIVKLNYEPINIKLFGKDKKNILKIALNQTPVWDMKLEFGAAKAYLDLSDYKINKFSMHTGASSTNLRFGDNQDTINVHIEMGAAALKIYIPRNSGCKIKGDMLLIAKDLDEFEKISNGRYITENFDQTNKKIFIDLDGGISSLKIIRY